METKTASEKRWLSPAQMAARTSVSIDTLRYYEREGLLKTVERASNGHRRYSVNDVHWVEVLRCLRETGMSIDQLRTYCRLGEQGDHTEPERLKLLSNHRKKVESDIELLRSSLTLIDHKISYYTDHIDAAQNNNLESKS